MKLPVQDPPIWENNASVSSAWSEGGYQRFALAGRSDIISALVEDGNLLLFPERSSQHKTLYRALVPEAE